MSAFPPVMARVTGTSTDVVEASRETRATVDVCYHCGLPNARASRWCATIAGERRTFCCAGCQAIAQAVDGAGLVAYYRQRTAPGMRADGIEINSDECTQWDDPAAQLRVVRQGADGRSEISLLLEGVQCSACTWLIESWMQRQPGVAEVSVNYATRRARVVWDASQTPLSSLLQSVRMIGYGAHPYDPARREALARSESRALLLRTAIALLAMMQVMMFALPTYVTIDGVEPAHRRLLEWASLTLTLPAMLYCAAPFFRGAWRDLSIRRPGMDVPIALGLMAAFAASAWSTMTGSGTVYYDSVTMFIALLLVARYVEFLARRRAGDAVEAIARTRPEVAERLPGWPSLAEGVRVAVSSLTTDDVVLVRPGGIVPADGIVIDGTASVEEALLTGEAKPRSKQPGAAVLAGSVARDGALVVRVTAAGDATRFAAIQRMVERASGQRPRAARMADRIAGHFVAVLLVITVFSALAWAFVDASRVLGVVFAVLAVSCPCALSLATPAAMAAVNGALSRRQVVITRSDALETLARVTHAVFDKTGTLTRGEVRLLRTRVVAEGHESDMIALATALERSSEHPIACAFRDARGAGTLPELQALRTVPGQGVEGILAGNRVRLGRFAFVSEITPDGALQADDADGSSTQVALGDEQRGLLAVFTLGDELRPGVRALIERLHAMNIATVLLSGDRQWAAQALGTAVGIRDARGDMLPADKRAAIASWQAAGAVVAMIGDGINDAPALAQANVSLSLGSATPLAQWTADVVVLSSDLDRIAMTVTQARRVMRIVRENLVWAFAYNVVAIPAAAFGYVTPLFAAIGMSLSSIAVVLNAARAASVEHEKPDVRTHRASAARPLGTRPGVA